MAVNLNLLPPELAVSKDLGRILKTLRAFSVIAVTGFLLFGAGIGAYIVINTLSLNSTNSSVASLKTQVSAQQKTEQQIVLLKDRIAKINSILGRPNTLANLKSISKLLSGFSGGVTINQMQISSDNINFSVNVVSNSDLTGLINSLRSNSDLKSVTLKSFSYSTQTGYTAEIDLTPK